MKISDYMPYLYNKNMEMNSIIYSEESELENKVKIDFNNAFKNNFPKIATLSGIEAWEQILGIELDSNRDNLEYRRHKVLTILSTTVPLSYRWLEENLTSLVGKDNFYLNVVNDLYKISINVSNIFNDTAETLYNLYRPLIPANLELYINLFEQEITTLKTGIIVHEGEKILIKGVK